jgi:hypothetical protein
VHAFSGDVTVKTDQRKECFCRLLIIALLTYQIVGSSRTQRNLTFVHNVSVDVKIVTVNDSKRSAVRRGREGTGWQESLSRPVCCHWCAQVASQRSEISKLQVRFHNVESISRCEFKAFLSFFQQQEMT